MTPAKRTLDPALVTELRERLLAERARLLGTVAATDEELATLERHQPGAPIEDVAREQVLAVLSRLGEQEKRELEDIYAAYAKLEAGAFGLCENCHGEMPLGRLRALPAARCCLSCQTRREARRP